MKSCFVLLLVGLMSALGFAQNVGDHAMAGQSLDRTSHNTNAGQLKPPLDPDPALPIQGATSADTMLVFEESILVGEGGTPPVYRLVSRQTGLQAWQFPMAGATAAFDYFPAYANDVVILGGSATTSVKAVQVSTGTQLWSSGDVGSSVGRFPLITDNLALFHGQTKLVAAGAASGVVFWEWATTTAMAPVAAFGNRVYALQSGGTLTGLNLRTGSVELVAPGAGGDGSSLIATEKHVFVADPVSDTVRAFRTTAGIQPILWSKSVTDLASPGIALAYNRLFVFSAENGVPTVSAVDPVSGIELWKVSDSLGPDAAAGVAQFGAVANGVVYFYNSGSERIRALDAFTGTAIWSASLPGVRGLSVTSRGLYALLDSSVRVFRPVNKVYLAQIADGEGASTLIALGNLSATTANGAISFFDNDGLPLPLEVEGAIGPSASFNFAIPAKGSVRIQTLGSSVEVTPGWAEIAANRQLSGTAVFQYSEEGEVLFEAGVGDAATTSFATVYASRYASPGGNEFNTGLAIANPADEEATVTIEFRRTKPTTAVESATVTLPPNGHVARFLSELFGEIAEGDVEGTLVINSDLPVSVSALRTQNGLQMSSYPVSQPVR